MPPSADQRGQQRLRPAGELTLDELEVLQSARRPLPMPRLNHATRCALVPWVKVSGTDAAAAGLQRVVADLRGGVQRFFHITLLQPALACAAMVGPHAGQAVGLQFHRTDSAFMRAGDAGRAWASTLPVMPSRFCTWWPTSWAMT
jgi:hypothetical protein